MRILDFLKKRPDGPAEYWAALAHERFQPDDLLRQAQEAERARFDACPTRREHVKRIKAIEKLGADVMCLMNVSGADPHAALRVYGESVLPNLRSG